MNTLTLAYNSQGAEKDLELIRAQLTLGRKVCVTINGLIEDEIRRDMHRILRGVEVRNLRKIHEDAFTLDATWQCDLHGMPISLSAEEEDEDAEDMEECDGPSPEFKILPSTSELLQFIETLQHKFHDMHIRHISPYLLDKESIASMDQMEGSRKVGFIGEKIALETVRETLRLIPHDHQLLHWTDFMPSTNYTTIRGWTNEAVVFQKWSRDGKEFLNFLEADFLYAVGNHDGIMAFDATLCRTKDLTVKETDRRLEELSEAFGKNIHLTHLLLRRSYGYEQKSERTHAFSLPCSIDVKRLIENI